MESVIERFLANESGYGCGDGSYGRDADIDSQWGHGWAAGYGDYKGCGYGRGDNPGRGLDDGNGSGESNFYVDGYERGIPAGTGAGVGGGIKSINGMPVYRVKDTPTIITSVHDDYAEGYIVENIGSLRPCYIAKGHGHFAHGDTLREAQEAIEAELQEEAAYEAELREEEAAYEAEAREEEALKAGLQESDLEATGTINGHDYVDLGLSVKWATCNVGTSSPAGCGDIFAWGDTEPKKGIFVEDDDGDDDEDFKPYFEEDFWKYAAKDCEDDNISGDPHSDAARANWGGTWRTPTKKEMKELIHECSWRWTTMDGEKGVKVKGPNGNWIFLPTTRQSVYDGLEWCYYWTASPYTGDYAIYLSFETFSGDNCAHIDFVERLVRLPIRPVSE